MKEILFKKRQFHLKTFLLVVFGVLAISATTYGINTVLLGYRVSTVTQTIAFPGCSITAVKGASGSDVFVPTKTPREWNRFTVNKPTNITIGQTCDWRNPQYLYHTVIAQDYPSVYVNNGGYMIAANTTTIDMLCYYAGLYTGNNWTKGAIISSYPSGENTIAYDSPGNNYIYRWNGTAFQLQGAGGPNLRFNNAYPIGLDCFGPSYVYPACPAGLTRQGACIRYTDQGITGPCAEYARIPCATTHGTICAPYYCQNGARRSDRDFGG